MYGPLGRARGKVERGLKGDEEISPDLGDLVGVASEYLTGVFVLGSGT